MSDHKYLFVPLFAFLSIAGAIRAEPPARNGIAQERRVKPTRGEILKLETNSITAMPFVPPMDNQRSKPETYTLDGQTRVLIGRLVEEIPTPSGGRVQSIKTESGTLEDLKVGKRVRIEAVDGRAVQIMIIPASPEG